jgi:NADH:ubiquinone oxidoreductase subunit F (NADH-binding)
MTAEVLDAPRNPGVAMPIAIPVGWLGEPRLLAGLATRNLTRLPEHLAVHGRLPEPSRDALIGLAEAAALYGRGGAAFPLARKLRALRRGGRPVVVVNGCEGEPASAKDSLLMSRAPHLVLDGAAVTAASIGAGRVLVAVTDRTVAASLQAAVADRPDRDLFSLRMVRDRFITGEARALVAALNGNPAVPPGRRVLPTERGVDGEPTILSNAETFAQLAVLVRRGPGGYGAGTTLITVTGAVANPGVLEIPAATTLGEVATAVGAYPSQAIVVGGYHGRWLAPDPQQQLSHARLTSIGATLGAGAVVFVGQHTCGLAELARIAGWLAEQSARQCGPCTFGLPALHADLLALRDGAVAPRSSAVPPNAARRPASGAARSHASLVTGRGACAHPDGAAGFVTSGLAALADDVRRHEFSGGCHRPDQANLPLTRAAAFLPMPKAEVAR